MNSKRFCIVHSPLARGSATQSMRYGLPVVQTQLLRSPCPATALTYKLHLLCCIDQGVIDFLIELSGYGSHIFVAVLAEE